MTTQYAKLVSTIATSVSEEEKMNKQLLEVAAEYPVEDAISLIKLCEFTQDKSQLARAVIRQFTPQMGFVLPFYLSVLGAHAFTENGSRHYRGGSISDVFALDKERKTDWGTEILRQFAKTDSPKLARVALRRQLDSESADGLCATMCILALQQDWIKTRQFRNMDAIIATHINKLGLANLTIGDINYDSSKYEGEAGHEFNTDNEEDGDGGHEPNFQL